MNVDSLRSETTELLQELLRIDTSNPPGNETPAARLLASYLERNGVGRELVARDPARANLLARLPGSGDGPSVMLLGHADVVPADASRWRRPPFGGELDEDGYVWGRGALDMKNEVATRAVAMAALARSAEPLGGNLVLAVVSDEEDGTNRVGMSWLVQERPDIASAFPRGRSATSRGVDGGASLRPLWLWPNADPSSSKSAGAQGETPRRPYSSTTGAPV